MNTQQTKVGDEKFQKSCRYGWCNYRPQFLQAFRHPWVALTILSACAFIQGFLVSGLVNVCISSVEKQFKLTSTQTGSVVSAYDIAFLIFATPISYLGGKPGVSKVRFLTLGMISLGLGSLVFASPQFISPPYAYHSVSETCTLKTPSQTLSTINPWKDTLSPSHSKAFPYFLSFFSGSFLNGFGGVPLYTLGITYIDENSPTELVSLYLGIYYAFSILGPAFGFFFGAYVLTYYVDFVKYTFLPHSKTYEWISNNILSGLSPGPNWVGAWWLGFVTCTALAWTVAIPLSGLPSRFPGMLEQFVARHSKMDTKINSIIPEKTITKTPQQLLRIPSHQGSSSTINVSLLSRLKLVYGSLRSSTETLFNSLRFLPKTTTDTNNINLNKTGGQISMKDTIVTVNNCERSNAFHTSLKSLLTNGTFMSITLAGAADGFILNGFAAFLPKYLEMQFGLSTKQASLYVGCATIPAGVLGMLLGGYVIKRFNVSVLGMLKITFIASLCNFSCLLVLLMTCPENRLAGVNFMPAHLRPPKTFINATSKDYEDWFSRRQALSNEAKIDFECNHNCNCHETYDPVCGSDVMYYSACHAGCHTKLSSDKSKQIVYRNCTCIGEGLKGEERGEAKPGACPTTCGNLLLFLSFIFFSLFLLLMVAVIAVMITLKCVGSNENSLSMGVQWVLVRLLGTIPGPIIFGKIIDRNCLFWEVKGLPESSMSLVEPRSVMSASENGSCKLYNNYAMGRNLFFLMVVSKMTSQIFYGIACFIYSRTASNASQPLVESEKAPKDDPQPGKRPFESLRVTTYPDLRGFRCDRGAPSSVVKSMSDDSLRPLSRTYKSESTWSPKARPTTYSR